MRAVLNAIKNVLIIIILIGFVTAGLDYTRMTSGELPIFNINSYDETTNIQTYRGMFYVAERKVKASINEPLVDSSHMKFKILTFDLDVPRKFASEEKFTIETVSISNCQEPSKLYYADLNVKVYLYCLESIDIKDGGKTKSFETYLKKNTSIIDDIDTKLDYMGLYRDNTTLMIKEKNDDFTNEGLTMYRCNKENINDVYFAPKDTPFISDFCTYKDDDLKFLFNIEDESEKPQPELDENGQPKEIPKEVFYSDDKYNYVFEYNKSDKVFITVPEVRGQTEKRYTLKEVLNNNLLTIDELEAKGLKFKKENKE